MASIKVDGASVHFPLYDAWNRSFKQRFVQVTSAGGLFAGRDRQVQIEAISDVSLEIGAGDRVAVLGSNGSGKTTLLRVLGGLLEPSRGSVEIDGEAACVLDIGFGFDPAATAYDTIVLHGLLQGRGLPEIRRRAEEMTEFCELAEVLNHPLRNLTPGHVFRLGTGLAFFFGADIVLYDEVFETVGPAFISKTKAHIDEAFAEDGILVVVERSRSILEGLCNRALVIDRGRIDDFDDFDAVMARHGAKYTL